MSPFRLIISLLMVACLFLAPCASYAQDGLNRTFEAKVRTVGSTTLKSDVLTIKLWGLKEIPSAGPIFDLSASTALANAVGQNPVECETKQWDDDSFVYAQCVNGSDIDLGLLMIQQGYVSVDRASIFGTVFEAPYIQAETNARDSGVGIWNTETTSSDSSDNNGQSLLVILGFILFLALIGTFTFLSIVIMRGFKQVIQAQNDNLEMMSKERKLRDRERGVVATMIDAEINTNKAKIEAYIVVYEEILKDLRVPDKTPKYKSSGDIVQKQPVLSRSVYDRNTDKLDILGRQLASDLIHFYARIKSQAEYINLEPEMPQNEAIDVVENCLKQARTLSALADDIIEKFERSGVMVETSQE